MRQVMSSSLSGDREAGGGGRGEGIMPQGMGGVGPWGLGRARGGMGDEAERDIKAKKKRRKKDDESKTVLTEGYDDMTVEPKVHSPPPHLESPRPLNLD